MYNIDYRNYFVGSPLSGITCMILKNQVTRAGRIPNLFLKSIQSTGVANKSAFLERISNIEETASSQGRYRNASSKADEIAVALNRIKQARSFIEAYS